MSFFSSLHPFITTLYVTALLLVIGLAFATVSSLLFQKIIYKKRYRPRYKQDYTPRCCIILPVKGIPKDLEKNLQAFTEIDYPDYSVIITVESHADPCLPVVEKITAAHEQFTLVIAGLATDCAQKNHNMLAALKEAGRPEIYVFADADIPPQNRWLHELVLPLSDPSLTATTGFRWLISNSATFGHLTHSNVNIFFLVLFGMVSLLKIGSILWGGSMAIRRKDFEELEVAKKWARSGVDDIAMARVLADNKRKSILVPLSVTPTDDLIDTATGTVTWCARQIMFLKAYHRGLWLALGLLVGLSLLFYLWLPAAVLIAAFTPLNFWQAGGGASLLFMLCDTLLTLLYPAMGPIPRFYRLFLLQPVLRITHLISYLKTLFKRSIVWAGIRYTLNSKGDVTRVERLT
jgi:cellulose synthase/poly-beta-1,6-N-acetylglucosamine synthase-like glycosyltransferase